MLNNHTLIDEETEQIGLKTRAEKTKLIAAAGVGNFLEIFDFTVYSFFAAVIGRVFFPSDDPLISLLIAVSVFGVGFVMRPLGSIIIGTYADRKGRKSAMLLTIILMAAGSAIIGFAPPYDTIGWAAPILIVLGRLLQGFSAGGEIGAATTLLMESAAKNERGFFVSWQFIGQGLSGVCGALFGAGLTYFLSDEALHSWGWRVPFIFALLIIPVGLYIRTHINETFIGAEQDKTTDTTNPVKELVTTHFRQFFIAIFMVMPMTLLMYIMVFYMPIYLKEITAMDATMSYMISAATSIIMIIFSLLAGLACDRVSRRKPLALSIIVISLISSWLSFELVAQFWPFFISLLITIAALGALLTTGLLIIMEAFPRTVRASATAMTYGIGVTIFGGTAQIVVTWLLEITNKNPMAPFWYLGGMLVVALIAYALFKEERYI
ncbi:MFS transporter [Brucellaceae bacterium C25G]